MQYHTWFNPQLIAFYMCLDLAYLILSYSSWDLDLMLMSEHKQIQNYMHDTCKSIQFVSNRDRVQVNVQEM